MKASTLPKTTNHQITLKRAKLRLFAFLAFAWGALATIGGILLWENLVADQFSGLDLLAWLLIVPEPLLILVAIYFWVNERPRRVVISAK